MTYANASGAVGQPKSDSRPGAAVCGASAPDLTSGAPAATPPPVVSRGGGPRPRARRLVGGWVRGLFDHDRNGLAARTLQNIFGDRGESGA